jgi:hypothetical protein
MNKKNSCEIQKYFLRVIFAKNFLAAALQRRCSGAFPALN